MKKFASLVLLSKFTFGITCGSAGMATGFKSSTFVTVGENSSNDQNKVIKNVEKLAYDGVIPCNGVQDKNIDIFNKKEDIKAESALQESKQAMTKNRTAENTGIVATGSLSAVGVFAGRLLLKKQIKKTYGKSGEVREEEESSDVVASDITNNPESPKVGEEKGIPKGLKIFILIYGILAAIIFLETTFIQMKDEFNFDEGSKCEQIFSPIGRGLLNGVFLGLPGFVNRNRYGGLYLCVRGYEKED